jgi:outer membrane protein
MRTTKILLILLILTAGVFSANAQAKSKIGVINIGELLKWMPEYDSIMTAYQLKYDQMETELKQMYAELEEKQAAYTRDQNNLTDMMKSIRMQELQDLQGRIQAYQEGAPTELNKFVEEKQAPILDKIRKAIKEVSVESGFTHVLNNSQDQVLYFDEVFDILPLVKAKLKLADKPLPASGK